MNVRHAMWINGCRYPVAVHFSDVLCVCFGGSLKVTLPHRGESQPTVKQMCSSLIFTQQRLFTKALSNKLHQRVKMLFCATVVATCQVIYLTMCAQFHWISRFLSSYPFPPPFFFFFFKGKKNDIRLSLEPL